MQYRKPRPNQRYKNSLWTALLAVLVVGLQSLAALHMSMERHEFCEEHGRLEEVAGGGHLGEGALGHQSASVDDEGTPGADSKGESGGDQTSLNNRPDGHLACPLVQLFSMRMAPLIGNHANVVSPNKGVVELVAIPATRHEQIPLLLQAPKLPPPA